MTILGVQAAEIGVLVGFHVFVIAMLVLDLVVLGRGGRSVTMRAASVWSAVWISLAMLFAVGIWLFWPQWRPESPETGGQKALEFVTGYLIELSLSVDNLFVFLVIFRYFAVPAHLQRRVLFWGILGAVIMRASFVLVGAALLELFHWMIYVFGAFLIYTAYKMLRSVEEDIDPGRNPLLRLARRFLPVIDNYESPRFWVKRAGRWHLTPLPLVLLVVESTDVVFALDSIPAIFAITTDTFIVYTSNIFAILGLRALFFLLAGFLGMFRYLNVGLALVLAFVGVKMIVEHPLKPYLEAYGIDKQDLILISLGVVALILTTSVVASVIKGPAEPLEHPPEKVTEDPREVPVAERAPSEAGESPVPPPSP